MRQSGRRGDSTRTGVRAAALIALVLSIMLLGPSLATAVVTPSKPVNIVAPSLTGTPTLGATLSCSTGSWTNNPTTFAYAWLRDGSPISGQAGSTYIVQTADQGHSISCQVTAGKLLGEYTITGLPTGSYKVEFSAGFEGGNYLRQYFNGKPSVGAADPVAATAGSTSPAINAALQTGGQIAGIVTDALTHAPISGLGVCANTSGGNGCASTNAAGEYLISGLASGAYTVTFEGRHSGGNYLSQTSGVISVTAGSTTSGIDAALQAGAQITGTVTDDAVTPAPLSHISVCAIAGSTTEFGTCATTNSAGEYTISGLASGEYKVRFSSEGTSIFGGGEGGNYLTQYYNNKPAESEGEKVSVTVGAGPTSKIDAKMHAGGQIKGAVTDASTHAALANIFVCAFGTTTVGFGGCTLTNAAGEYTISSLPSGSYNVEFLPGFEAFFGGGAGSNYVGQLYNGKSFTETPDPVAVTVPLTTSSINAELQRGGEISGKVTDASTHAPLANIEVCATKASSGTEFEGFGGCASTNAAGEYTIVGLETRAYRVTFFPGEGVNYLTQSYNGKSSEAEANLVAVSAPSVTTGINAEMHPGAQISGKVIAAAGGAPLAHIEVCAVNVVSGGAGGCATTNSGASSASAISNTLAVPLPNSTFKLVKRPVFDAKRNELDFFFTVANPGTFRWSLFFKNADVGFADSLGLSLGAAEGNSRSTALAEVARRHRSKRCKRGTIKHHGRCVHAQVPFGAGSQSVPAGLVEIKVHASSKAIKALNAGRTLHVSGPFTFQSALGGAPVTQTESAVVRKPKKHRGKHGKHHRH